MAVQLGFPDKYYICARYGTEVLLNDASISDSDKLLIYALGQQAEYGENKTPKPSIFDTVARAKWNAWAELGKRSPFEAMFMYTQAVDELAPEWWKWPPLKLVEGADDGADDDGVPPPAAVAALPPAAAPAAAPRRRRPPRRPPPPRRPRPTAAGGRRGGRRRLRRRRCSSRRTS